MVYPKKLELSERFLYLFLFPVSKHFQHIIASLKADKNLTNKQFLLAVSGGVDSMVLVDVFNKANLNFLVAHCNFKLRGNDSELDEQLVKETCLRHNISFFSKNFDTKNLLKSTNKSVQMLARDLRYQWFKELKAKHNLHYIVTAHHLNDQIETFFINLSRGTGLTGLEGMNELNQDLFRPFLQLSKQDFYAYANQHNITYREDKSNQSNDYKRNLIRNEIVPLMKQLNPSFEETMLNNLNMVKQSNRFLTKTIEHNLSKGVIRVKGDVFALHKKSLLSLPFLTEHLFHFLKGFGFTYSQINQLTEVVLQHSQAGKLFYSKTHKLLNDREELLLYPIKQNQISSVNIKKGTKNVTQPVHLSFDILPIEEVNLTPDAHKAFLDADKLTWPLTIRKWEQGDVFYPLGMTNKQKLSDFLINKKLNLVEKDDVLVVESGGEICWIITHRISNKFKLTSNTRQVLLITKNQHA